MAKKNQPKNLEKLCMRKWYLEEYKGIKLFAEEGFEALGLEGGLEICYNLLEDGVFVIKAFDLDKFFLFLTRDKGESYELIFDSKEPETQKA